MRTIVTHAAYWEIKGCDTIAHAGCITAIASRAHLQQFEPVDGAPIMALWKEQSPPTKEMAPAPDPVLRKDLEVFPDPVPATPRPAAPAAGTKESLIAEELTIEGKIEGTGHVRIAGRFKGDVHVQGNLTIEPGATLTGGVRANMVSIAGHLEGNIDSASRVELLSTGVLNGDLSAESLTVAAGSRMRGKAEFGWDGKTRPAGGKGDNGANA
jgi:cytoskeletal protein CcmA (bactofilin family)